MFLLNATIGGEDGTASCAKPDNDTTRYLFLYLKHLVNSFFKCRCLYSPDNVYVENSILHLVVPGPTKVNATIGAAQVSHYFILFY